MTPREKTLQENLRLLQAINDAYECLEFIDTSELTTAEKQIRDILTQAKKDIKKIRGTK